MDLSHHDSMGISYETRPKIDLVKAVKDLEDGFCNEQCGLCGKEFYRTYFVICPDCLTEKQKAERRITT